MLKTIFRNIEEQKERNAFCIGKQYYTYGDLGGCVARIRGLIRKRYPSSVQNRVGIFTGDNLETYAAILALWAERQIFIPLNPSNPVERNKNIIGQAGIELLLFPDVFPAGYEHVAESLSLSDFDAGDVPWGNMVDHPEDILYILFTSGSTGTPKGVQISVRNLSSFVLNFIAAGYDFSPEDRFLQIYDLTFDASVHCYSVPLTVGACVYTVPQNEIKFLYAYKLMSEYKLTFVKMPPSTLVYLKPWFSRIMLPELRYCLLGGEACYENIVREWQHCVPNAQIQNVYGPTEATINCTKFNYDGKDDADVFNGIVSIGRPFGENNCVILNSENKEVKRGDQGELCVAGSQITPGYLNNPEKNRKAFITFGKDKGREVRYYRTGDLVFENNRGNLMYLGRIDNQVQIDGYRVELGEIESCVVKFTGKNVFAFAKNDPRGKPQICVAVAGYEGDTSQIMRHLEKELPRYMIPQKILNPEKFPHTPGGKIDTGKLKKMFTDE